MTEQEVCNESGDTRGKGLDTDPVGMEEANDLARVRLVAYLKKWDLAFEKIRP